MPKGVREQGGLLNHPTRNLRVRCLPADIPAEIKVDITELGLDESLLLKDVTPPKGVTFLGDPHTVLARVSMVEEEKAAEPVPGAAAGPEVITEKKADGDAAAGASAAGGKAAPAAPAAKGAPAAKAPGKK